MAEKSVLLRLGADASGLTKGLQQGEQGLTRFNETVDTSVEKLTRLAEVVGLGLGLAELTHAAMEFSETMTRVGLQTGMSNDQVQALNLIAKQTGTTVEALASTVNKMQKSLVAADEDGKKAAAALAQLGIDAGTLLQLDPSEQLMAIAKGLAEIPNPAERSAEAIAILGKSGAEALPTLLEMAEKSGEVADAMERIGGPVSADAIKAVDDLDHAAETTKQAFVNLATELLSDVAPACVSFLEVVQEVVGGLRHLGGQGNDAMVNLDSKITAAKENLDTLKASAYASFGGISQNTLDAIKTQEALIKTLEDQYNAQQQLGVAGVASAKGQLQFQTALRTAADEAQAALLDEANFPAPHVDIEAVTEEMNAESAARIDALKARHEAEKAEEQAQVEWLKSLQESSNEMWGEMGEELSKKKIQTWQQETQSIAQLLQTQTEGVTQHSKAMFEINKAAGIVNTIINTVQAVVKAWADYGWPVGAIVGAAVAAAGAVQVQQIASTTFGSKTAPSQANTPATPVTGAGGGNGGGGGSQGNGQTLRVEGLSGDQFFSAGTVRSLAGKLLEFQKDGGQVVLA